MLEDFERWPRYKELYIKAFDEITAKPPSGKYDDKVAESGVELFEKWLRWCGN